MYSISDEKIYDLVGLIYETSREVSPDAWLEVYKRMSALLSSGAGSLSLYSKSADRFDFVASTLDADLLKEYENYYQYVSPFRQHIVRMNAGDKFSRAEHLSDKEFLKTELYQEYFKKQDVFNYDYQVLFKDSNLSGGVSFSRSEKMSNFGKNEQRAIKIIMPHLRRAFQVYMKVSEIQRDNQLLIECLGKISQGIIVVNKAGKIVFINEYANRIIARKDGLQINRYGMLLANATRETRKLQNLLQSVFENNAALKGKFGGITNISRASGTRPLSLLIAPFSQQNQNGFNSEIFALIFVNDPEQKIESVEPVLREIYGLTPAEAKIAAILAQGNSLKDVCETLRITQNTGRTHLKRIFSKTETNRQGELVKLILNSTFNLGSNMNKP